MSEEDIGVVEAVVQAWNQGDREGVLATFHPDGRWASAIKRQVEGGEGLYEGRDEIGEFWDEWHAVWNDLEIVISELRNPSEGLVVGFGSLRGTGVGSGADTERPFGWVFQIEGGLIREVRAYLSRSETLKAAGLSE
jgi:hypothetical protein